MPTPPNVPEFFQQYERAKQALDQAWAEGDAANRARLIAEGHAYAALAQVSGAWLAAKLP